MPERNDEMTLREALMGAVTGGSADGESAALESNAVGTAETDAMSAEADTSGEGTADTATYDVGSSASAPATTEAPPVNATSAASQNIPSQAEMWGAFSRLMAENQQLKSALQQSSVQAQQQNAAMRQQSQAAENAIMGQFTPEAAVPKTNGSAVSSAPPVLNMQEFSYLSPEEQQQRLSQWQQETMAHAIHTAAAQIKDEVTREMAPIRDDYEKKQQIAADAAAKATLFGVPQFADMKEREGDMERIIARTPVLQGATPQQKYMLAALIDRGLRASKQPTTEDLIRMASSNPDVMKALDAQRVSEIQKNNASLPKVVPSSGMGNANAVPDERPTNVDGVKNLLLNRLGIRR